MLGPSPDWIVGVSGLELCLTNCTWVDSKELFLYPWDAGVDNGISYESPDSPSNPHMPITRLPPLKITTLDLLLLFLVVNQTFQKLKNSVRHQSFT